MNIKIPIFIYSLLYTHLGFTQIAASSVFRETKSINPAIVSMRPAGAFSLLGSSDKVTKTQDQSENYDNGEAIAEIEVNRSAIFYGGRGGGFTSELFIDISKGDKKTTLKADDQETSFEDKIISNFSLLSFGFSPNFGLSIGMANSEYQNKYEGTFNGYSFSSDFEYKGNTLITRIGTTFGSSVAAGMFLEMSQTQGTNKSEDLSESTSDTGYAAGIGFASKSNSHHYELSFEIIPFLDDSNGDASSFPQRLMLTLEQRLSFITFGYSGRLYRNGFGDTENMIYTNLVFNDFTKDRIEHKFNFAFGAERGHSLSGSLTLSDTTSVQPDIVSVGSEEKYETRIQELGISIKYSYNF